MLNDTVSIIVPIYNKEKYLEKCLDSILGQTYRDLEIILVDDGSTDNSLAICQRYAEKNLRIKIYHKSKRWCFFCAKSGIGKKYRHADFFC